VALPASSHLAQPLSAWMVCEIPQNFSAVCLHYADPVTRRHVYCCDCSSCGGVGEVSAGCPRGRRRTGDAWIVSVSASCCVDGTRGVTLSGEETLDLSDPGRTTWLQMSRKS